MQKKIKIIHLIPSLGLGGAEKVVLNLCRGIDREKYALSVVYWGEDETLLGPLKATDVEVIKLKFGKVISFESARKIADVLKRSSADIVHTHFIDADLLGFVAAMLAGIPWVVHIHSYPFPEKTSHRIRYRIMSMRAKAVIGVSGAVKQHLVRNVGISPDKAMVVYNGLDFPENYGHKNDADKRSIKEALGIGQGCRVVGNISRMVRCKGQEYLIQAMPYILRKDPDVKCLIIGDGVLRGELENLAGSIGVADKVIFAGTRRDIEDLLSIMDVFAYPAFDEAMGLAVLEAMAAEKPIAASCYPAIPELVEHGKEGILVNPCDQAAFAGAVLKLLFDPASADRMAKAAKKKVEKFSNAAMINGIEAIYGRITSAHKEKKEVPRNDDGRIRLLYVHNKKDISGGERSLLNLWKNLDRDKFALHALLPGEGELSREARKCGVKVDTLVIPGLSSLDFLGIVGAFSRLCGYIRKDHIDIVHSCSPRNNVISSLAGKALNVPVIWHERNLIFGRERDVSRDLLFLADAVICNSDAVAERFRVNGALPSKVKTVLNGTDLKEFSPEISAEEIKRELGASGKRVVGILTNLNKRKRVEHFLKAAPRVIKRAKDVLFLVVGGEFSDEASGRAAELKDMAVMLGLKDNIVFTGFRDDVTHLLASFDISVHVTEKEACSRAIIESMAAGKPVVAMDDGGNPELIESGVTGILVPPSDLNGLVDAVVRLLDNAEERLAMGRRSRERAEKLFDVKRNAKETENIYIELARGRDAHRR